MYIFFLHYSAMPVFPLFFLLLVKCMCEAIKFNDSMYVVLKLIGINLNHFRHLSFLSLVCVAVITDIIAVITDTLFLGFIASTYKNVSRHPYYL